MNGRHRWQFFCDDYRPRFIVLFLAVTACWLFINCVSAFDKNLMAQRMQVKYNASGMTRLHQWLLLVDEIKDKTDLEKIKSVNQFFNSNINFQDDKILWKNLDYWATPLDTLGIGAGDCEDYAIAKYFTLLEANIAVERLRFIYVKAQIGDKNSRLFQAHMVLGYYESEVAVPLILDNLITNVEAASQRPDLKPVFSFNSDGIWVGNQPAKNTDPTARLSRWRDLLQRTHADGF